MMMMRLSVASVVMTACWMIRMYSVDAVEPTSKLQIHVSTINYHSVKNVCVCVSISILQ